jgi:hypothetical protein
MNAPREIDMGEARLAPVHRLEGRRTVFLDRIYPYK